MAEHETREVEMMLYQLHWQNRDDTEQTEFIAQAEFTDADALNAWANEIIERRRSEIPAGWIPMICNQKDHRFVYPVAPA